MHSLPPLTSVATLLVMVLYLWTLASQQGAPQIQHCRTRGQRPRQPYRIRSRHHRIARDPGVTERF
jgi:hypothetical protein